MRVCLEIQDLSCQTLLLENDKLCEKLMARFFQEKNENTLYSEYSRIKAYPDIGYSQLVKKHKIQIKRLFSSTY